MSLLNSVTDAFSCETKESVLQHDARATLGIFVNKTAPGLRGRGLLGAAWAEHSSAAPPPPPRDCSRPRSLDKELSCGRRPTARGTLPTAPRWREGLRGAATGCVSVPRPPKNKVCTAVCSRACASRCQRHLQECPVRQLCVFRGTGAGKVPAGAAWRPVEVLE